MFTDAVGVYCLRSLQRVSCCSGTRYARSRSR